MKDRSTYLLLVLFFSGLIGLIWAEYARIPTASQQRVMTGKILPELLDVKPAEVGRVEIDGGKERLAFERREGGWQMTAPLDALADKARVDGLVMNLRSLPRLPDVGTIEGPAEKFGLDRPARVVRLFKDGDKQPLATLEVGKAIGDHRYVRPSGGGIELADARLLAAVDVPPVEWRERSLFVTAAFDVEALDARGPDRALEARRVEQKWRLIRPIRAPGDEAKIDGLLADLSALRVADGTAGFVADDVKDFAKYGLDKPSWVVELTAGEAPRRRAVHFGKAVPDQPGKVYARRADQDDVVVVEAKVLDALAADPHGLRSKKVADLAIPRVDYIRIEAGGQEHRLARGERGWRVLAPAPGMGDRQAIEGLLKGLNGLQFGELLESERVDRAGLDPPAMAIAVWEDGIAGASEDRVARADLRPEGPPALSLQLGRPDLVRKLVYGRTEGDPAVMTLPTTAAQLVPEGSLAFRSRSIQSLDPRRLVGLTLVRGGRTIELAAPATGGENFRQWRMTAPVRAPVEGEVVGRIVGLLSGLRAESLVRESAGDLKTFGLDAPVLSVSWKLRPGGPASASSEEGTVGDEGTLRVGAEVPGHAGSRYAQVAGQSTIFTLGPRWLEILEAEPRDHTVFRFALPQVTRLILRGPGRTVALARQPKSLGGAEAWVPEPGSDATGIDLPGIEPLLTMLSALKTTRFLQYEGPFPAEAGLDAPALTVEVELSGGFGTRQLRLGRPGPEASRYATADPGRTGAVFLQPMLTWERWVRALGGPASELPADPFAH
jgi:hypothetical protein